MSLKHIKLETFKGRGANQKSLGFVEAIKLMAETDLEFLTEIEELRKEKSVVEIVSALNYGLAVKARSTLRRPENQFEALKKSVALNLRTEKSAAEIANLLGLSITDVENILAEEK